MVLSEKPTGKPIPYEVGADVGILIGPYKGRVGKVIGDSDGYPRQWVMVECDGKKLMYDQHQVYLAEGY